jgi:hypothetical protein
MIAFAPVMVHALAVVFIALTGLIKEIRPNGIHR